MDYLDCCEYIRRIYETAQYNWWEVTMKKALTMNSDVIGLWKTYDIIDSEA